MTEMGDFDLNIEKVLEAWAAHHAVRELIANALDEHALCARARHAEPRSVPSLKRSRFESTAGAPELAAHAMEEAEIKRIGLNHWSIRDFGRGLRHTHLTENECAEKLEDHHGEVIGRFGFGLKDALAVLHRLGVDVSITSAHCALTLVMRTKAAFKDVVTLHARLQPSPAPDMKGTEIVLRGVNDEDVQRAKKYFLRFSDDKLVESTQYGQILRDNPIHSFSAPGPKSSGPYPLSIRESYQVKSLGPKLTGGRIYINGMVVAEEPHFAFSYNITSLTEPMRRSLNRERTNVGRSAYSGRMQDILLAAKSDVVTNQLIRDMENYNGAVPCHDEVKCYVRIKEHACLLRVRASEPSEAAPPALSVDVQHDGDAALGENPIPLLADAPLAAVAPPALLPPARKPVMFVTQEELIKEKELVDRAIRQGIEIMQVPHDLAAKLPGLRTASDKPMPVLDAFRKELVSKVITEFVEEEQLTDAERAVFGLTARVASLVGGIPPNVKEIKIAEKLYDSHDFDIWGGLWQARHQRVIIRRAHLASVSRFAGTLIHELTHARTGYGDVTREFESALTSVIGLLAEKAVDLSTMDLNAILAPFEQQ